MEFRVLGAVEAWHSGTPIDLGRRKMERRILGLLLISLGRSLSVDRLADLLWDGEPPERARRTIQVAVSRLRARLAAADAQQHGFELLTRSTGYLLQGDTEKVDLHQFRALCDRARAATDPHARESFLRQALALSHGPLLGSDANDRIRDRIGAEYNELFLSATELRIEADLELGSHTPAIAELAALSEAHPHRERLTELRMLALYRAGRRQDALTAYTQARQALADGTGLDPRPELAQLHQRILRGDPALELSSPAKNGSEPTADQSVAVHGGLVPAQLPAATLGFAGRSAQLAQLDHTLADLGSAAQPAVVIAGTGGVGKTALALHWAHQIRQRFPDGQLYINLHSYSSTQPVRAIDALGRFLRALGASPERVPTGMDEAASMYRTLLADKKMLIVLDNAGDPDQVRPLLPGTGGSLVLITSRDRLDGLTARDGARRLDLDALTCDEAEALLRQILGEVAYADPHATAELARLCAYLPLAVRIAAAQVASHPDRDVAALVAKLRDGDRLSVLSLDGDAQASISATFRLSYQTLDAQSARTFRLLGLIPGADFTAAAVAALTGTTIVSAGQMLDQLVTSHLVETCNLGRHSLHDLLRLFAYEQTNAGERSTGTDRLFGWYLSATAAATKLLYPSALRLPMPEPSAAYENRQTALAWLDAELANLTAVITHSAEHGPYPMAWLLTDSLRDHFRTQSRLTEWLSATQAAVGAATMHGDPLAQAAAHLSRGSANNNTGDAAGAVAEYTAGLDNARAAGWKSGTAAILNNLGIIRWRTGNLDLAADHLIESLTLNRALSAGAGEAHSLASLASIYRRLSRPHDAREHLTQALRMFEEHGYEAMAAMAHNNLSHLHRDIGEPETALALAAEALCRARELGNRQVESLALRSLAEAHLDTGDYESSRRHLTQALDLAQSTGDTVVQADCWQILARINLAAGRPAEAAQLCEQALELIRDTDNVLIEAPARLGLAAAQRHLGLYSNGLENANQILTAALHRGDRMIEASARTELANILAAQADSH